MTSRRSTAKALTRTKRPTPGARGWPGPGGGASLHLRNLPWWRTTSNQGCGLFPFAVGAGIPISGVPLGPHQDGAGTVCMDPISWFLDGYISSPSMAVIGLNGQGKSGLIRKLVIGRQGMGTLPLILGDTKGEYRDVIETLDGQIIELGPGRGKINPLDPGETAAAARTLADAAEQARAAGNTTRAATLDALRVQLLAEAHAHATTMTSGLITILRGGTAPEDYEESILDVAIRLLEERHRDLPTPPEITDLLNIIVEGPRPLHDVAVAADDAEYRQLTVRLRRSLQGLLGTGRLGDTFAGQTTTGMRRDKPICVDISAIDDTRSDLQAAVLLGTYSQAFAMVAVAHTLADAGLEPRQHWFVVMDEFWRVLRSGSGMVDRVDALTRLDRRKGVGRAFIFHTMEDLEALPEIDRLKARGFVARSGVLVTFGLPPSEMLLLRGVTHFSRKEERQITSWTTPQSWAQGGKAPGIGKCLIKVGRRPGIPVKVRFTQVEESLGDTNQLWLTVNNTGSATDLAVAGDRL